MTEETKTPVVNAEAEKDVQNVLAELKEGATEQPAQDEDEARIVAAAAAIGQKAEAAEEKTEEPQTEKRETRHFQRDGRGPRQNNAKFDPSTQEVTDDPVQIRKQV